jgi:1,4-alpha-glucan branching enzyme
MLTFRAIYAFTENYILALSHDEVVHGKKSLLDKHPGDEWKRFASYRSMLGYQWALPGKKLLFMGAEIADPREWDHNGELPFHLLDYPVHAGVMRMVGELNRLYRETPALHHWDTDPRGFQWIEADDISRATLAFLRLAEGHPPVVAVCNFTPEAWHDYRLGVPVAGPWKTLLCTDADEFGGSGLVPTGLETVGQASHGHDQSLTMLVPPMSVTFLTPG